MKVKPMIFNTDMVRALLDGRKVQTRRPITFPVKYSEHTGFSFMDKLKKWWACGIGFGYEKTVKNFTDSKSPWHVGDLIYVRETFYQRGRHVMPMWPEAEPEDAVFVGERDVRFIGDELPDNGRYFGDKFWRKRPSIHMPRWASRLTLKVTDVRVERVQDISEQDAVKEGVHTDNPLHVNWASADFSRIWHSVYPGSWERNDWVWVIDFEVIHRNVDDYLKAQEHAA